MSQNKTVIQGFEPADQSGNNGGIGSGFYSRGGNGRTAARGTVVSGMTDGPQQGVPRNPNATVMAQTQNRPMQTGKPVVGFLYSVSRTAAGEYWPLQIGQNTIGKSSNCDIVLPEGTVSSEHAVLVVRKMKNPEKVIASISDARSTNGTMLNGVSLGFTAEECKNGDIITIGDNYELFLILIDAASLGLRPSVNFITIEEDTMQDPLQDIPTGYTRPEGQYTPPPFGGGFTPTGGTMGFDGQQPYERGGTIGM